MNSRVTLLGIQRNLLHALDTFLIPSTYLVLSVINVVIKDTLACNVARLLLDKLTCRFPTMWFFQSTVPSGLGPYFGDRSVILYDPTSG